jgi:hypothetical protein
MKTLLTTYTDINRGFAELEEITQDPESLVEMLERIRAQDGPNDLKSAVILAMCPHRSSDSVMTSPAGTISHVDRWRERSIATVALAHTRTRRVREILTIALIDQDRRVRANAKLATKQIDRHGGRSADARR